MADYIPSRELDASKWLTNFGITVQTWYPDLYITEAEANSINTATEQFALMLTAEQTARLAYENAVNDKNVARANAEQLARTYGQKFRGDQRVTASRLIELGLTPRTSSRQPVLNPASDLVATVDAQTATVALKWNRNGSTPGTSFMIQQKVGTAGTWSSITATTKTRLSLPGIPAGIPRFYRVIATRAGKSAGASNVSVIYQSGTGLLAAAA